MGKHLKNLKAASKESIAVFFYYSRERRHSPGSLFLFFEGDEDPSYYNPYVRDIFGKGVDIKSCICNGRAGVLDVLKKVKKQDPTVNNVLFFVDADFTRFIGEATPRSKFLYMTDGYSIENNLVSASAFEIILVDILKLNVDAHPVGPLIQAYLKLMEEFEKKIASLMALIIFYKKRSAINLQNLDLKDFLTVSNHADKVVMNWNVNVPQILALIQADQTQYSWTGHLKCYRELIVEAPERYIRGKYVISFFHGVVQETQKIIVAKGKYGDLRRIIKAAIPPNTLFDVLSPRLDIPDSLYKFLSRARRRFSSPKKIKKPK